MDPLKAPVMKQVAERAGVAISSVSRVLSDHPDVSEDMKTRVLEAVASLGYEPDMGAKSLRTGQTKTIGFVATDIGNPLFASIAQGAETALRARGYSMLLANSFSDSGLAVQQLRSMQQRRVDGVLLSVSDENDPKLVEAVTRAPFPIVLLDRAIGSMRLSSVLSDHESGIIAAVDYLMERGHRRVALINGSRQVRPSRERAKAIRRLSNERSELVAIVRMGEFTASHGERTMRELMAADSPPTAVIAGSNQILVGVLRAVRELGLRVPDDIGIVTCDDVALSEFLTPALTTISRDPTQMGTAAAKLILRRMSGAPVEHVLLPTGFRPTDSV